MGHSQLDDTEEYIASDSPAAMGAPRRRFVKVEPDIAAVSDPGKVRENNEDHYLVASAGRYLRTWMTNLPAEMVPDKYEDVAYGIVVADGLGGMARGEVASREAIAHFVRLVLETPDWIFGLEEPDLAEVMRRAAVRFSDVNAALLELARRDPKLQRMGTTLTLVMSLGTELLVAHVGDSRVYLLRRETLRQLTRDHTQAQELVDKGLLAAEDAATHRLRNVLTEVVGIWPDGGAPDIERIRLEDGDRLLVCTDGLTGMVDDATIAAELDPKRNASADSACSSLLNLALERGGKDNVTIVVASYHVASEPGSTTP